MVLLAASIVTRSGRPVVSRQFVDMTRARIEGLLAAFPKLIPKDGGQHTFIETESVRYVYQPIEKLYMVLITTKNSNILEDLETLRLFARVIPEYCRNQDETDIGEHAFELIFAFDEVVALGYRESVNLAQIRSFTEMDSHEEKVAIALREQQEKEARQKMMETAKKLQKERRDAARGGRSGGFNMNSFSSFGQNSSSSGPSTQSDTPVATNIPKATSAPRRPTNKGLVLKKKGTDDAFLDALASEGQKVIKKTPTSKGKSESKAAQDALKTKVADVNQEAVHIRLEEKINAVIGRDGEIGKFGIAGFVYLHINEEDSATVSIQIENNDSRGAMMQTHPNIDKNRWKSTGVIGLKNPDKPFPLGQDVGVLKWRLNETDEDALPLKVVCWPNDTGNGSCDVNVEYELQVDHLELVDVNITIPVPSGCGAPNINDCDGAYNYDQRKNILSWTLPVIDKSNPSGQLDFSMTSNEDDFFPVNVEFHSPKTLYTEIKVQGVTHVASGTPAKYSTETGLLVEKYTIGADE